MPEIWSLIHVCARIAVASAIVGSIAAAARRIAAWRGSPGDVSGPVATIGLVVGVMSVLLIAALAALAVLMA